MVTVATKAIAATLTETGVGDAWRYSATWTLWSRPSHARQTSKRHL